MMLEIQVLAWDRHKMHLFFIFATTIIPPPLINICTTLFFPSLKKKCLIASMHIMTSRYTGVSVSYNTFVQWRSSFRHKRIKNNVVTQTKRFYRCQQVVLLQNLLVIKYIASNNVTPCKRSQRSYPKISFSYTLHNLQCLFVWLDSWSDGKQ